MANNLIIYFIPDMVPTEEDRIEAERINSLDINNEVVFMNTRFGADFMACSSVLGCVPENFAHMPIFGAEVAQDKPNEPPPPLEPKSLPVGKEAWKAGI